MKPSSPRPHHDRRTIKKAWLLGGTHVVAALIGAGIASAYCMVTWNKAVRGAALSNDAAISAHYAALVETSRGDEREYERALQAYVKALDVVVNREPKSELYETMLFDKAVSLARLALIAEKRGENAHVAGNLKEATLACEASGRNDCTTENLRDWAARLPIATKTDRRAK